MPTTSADCSRSDISVKSTTSGNRIDAAANWSAIVAVSALSRSAINRRGCSAGGSRHAPAQPCSAASASSRWRANCARSPNTTAPATVTLSAIIVLANHGGSVDPPPISSPTRPGDEEQRDEGDKPAHAATRPVEHEGAERGKDAPQADGSGRQEAAHERHRDRWGEQDVEQFDPQEPLRVARVRAKIAIAPTEIRR